MPVAASVAQAAENYRFNEGFVLNTVKDLSPEEWLKRPTASTNHVAWIVGHVIWSRKMVLARLGSQWSAPWLGLFARGEKVDDTAAYPSPDTMMDAWREVSGVLTAALENASDEALAAAAGQPGPPSADGKLSGVIRFMAWHETYHVGQIGYVRIMLGHKGLMG
jgi:uncharacterized damage-inducible protein DinB